MQWYERKLPMSVGDMVHEYRQAKDPNKQLVILAELCDTKPIRIAWLLKRAGCTVDYKKLPRARRNEDSVDFVALWENSEEAKQADQIRERTIEEKQEMYAEEMPVPEGIESTEDVKEVALPADEMPVKEPKEIDGMTLFREGFVEAPVMIPEPPEEPDMPCPVEPCPVEPGPVTEAEITAEFWDVFMRYRSTAKTLGARDVHLMQKLAEVAAEMVE